MTLLKKLFFFAMAAGSVYFGQLFSLEQIDQLAIEEMIQGYTNAWNYHKGKGFGNGFSENATFVNIFGCEFYGREEIEKRHIKILETFLKDSILEITHLKLCEIQPKMVTALVEWKVNGFKAPETNSKEIRKGIFTQIFVKDGEKWEIVASQNTLKAE